MSALLFNFISHLAIDKLKKEVKLSVKSSQKGAHADDVVIMGRNENAVLEDFEELE